MHDPPEVERLFLDANVIFSAAYLENARLLALWKLRGVLLCSSRYAVEEARINLEQPSQRERIDELAGALHFFENFSSQLPPGIVLPEKDIPILAAAIEAKADYLLTGDVRHFGPYLGKKVEGVTILLPGDYLGGKRHR